ncbi:MAG: T9SS type A sorting domain-containing protein, partial [Flavobacteriales bacterium]
TGIKYLGLNLDISGNSHLGWISLEVAASNDTIILHDIGYNTISSNGITAGQMNLISVNEIRSIDFEIYPNPCQNIISIDWPNSYNSVSYSISDLSGQLLINGVITKNIDISTLASGTYILTIAEGQNIGRNKFTKN